MYYLRNIVIENYSIIFCNRSEGRQHFLFYLYEIYSYLSSEFKITQQFIGLFIGIGSNQTTNTDTDVKCIINSYKMSSFSIEMLWFYAKFAKTSTIMKKQSQSQSQ